MHLFLVANLVTTSKALVTRSDALVPSSRRRKESKNEIGMERKERIRREGNL